MAQPPGHVTGVGGVFIKSKDPKALLAWYRDVLGLEMKPWGGAAIPLDAPGHPPVVVWSPFSATTDYMAPSTREFMINLAVDDMEAIIARLTAKGVTGRHKGRTVAAQVDEGEAGRSGPNWA